MRVKDYGPATAFVEKWRKNHNGTWRKQTPWQQAYGAVRSRVCGYSERDRRSYFGIKALVSCKEMRELFFRDKAYNMRSPSVDRIDPDGHYVKDNIRWIELSNNRNNRGMNARTEKYLLGKTLLENFWNECGWFNNLRRAFLLKMLKELPKSKKWGIRRPLKTALLK